MTQFFKDQKFMIIYFHNEDGISVSKISEKIVDEDSKSMVIAARGDEPIDGLQYLDNGYHFEKFKNCEIKWSDVYRWYKYRDPDADAQQLQSPEDIFSSELLSHLVSFAEGKVVKLLILLAFDNCEKFDALVDDDIKFFKRGGSELVVEFMLSKYVHETHKGWFHKIDGRPLESENFYRLKIYSDPDIQAIHSWGVDEFSEDEMSELEERWHYCFGLGADLDVMLNKQSSWNIDSHEYLYYYHYNINLTKLPLYRSYIDIPDRVNSILTDEQKRILLEQAHEIILKNIDDVGRDFFALNFDSFSAHEEYRISVSESRQWGADLHGSIAEGNEKVYLGDGMYLDSDGNVLDD